MTTLCPACQQRIRTAPTGLVAERIGGLHWLGRQVYRIVGKPGLWQMHDPGADPGETLLADSIVGKGAAARRFWRIVQLECRIGAQWPGPVE